MKTLKKLFLMTLIACFHSMNTFGQTFYCPTCYGPAPCTGTTQYTPPVFACPPNLPYVLVFDDEFTGDALDLSRWQTCDSTCSLKWGTSLYNPTHGGYQNALDFDDGKDYTFNHPGVTLRMENASTFWFKAFDYDPRTKIEYKGLQNYRQWSYTSSNLYSAYNFPSAQGNLNGIYVLTCTLPTVPNPYSSNPFENNPYGYPAGSYGDIWPAFWMQSQESGQYGELDGFEFTQSQYDDLQNTHAPISGNGCAWDADPGSTNFGNGASHTFSLVYSIDDHEWYVDNTLTRQDAEYYYHEPSASTIEPYFCGTSPSVTPDYYIQNGNFPDIHMRLNVTNGVVNISGVNSGYFPVHFDIQSVKYYIPMSCSGTTIINNPSSLIVNDLSSNNAYNIFTGGTIDLNCGTNTSSSAEPAFVSNIYNTSYSGGIYPGFVIPLLKAFYGGPWLGQLKLIAANSIVITGGFQASGYFVAKTDGNLCNEYSGPLPHTPTGHRPIKPTADSTNNSLGNADSLTCFVKESITHGRFTIGLKDIGTNELNQTASIEVYNTMGQNLFKGNLLVQEGNELPIDLSTQARGVYLVIIRTTDMIFHKKVVMQ